MYEKTETILVLILKFCNVLIILTGNLFLTTQEVFFPYASKLFWVSMSRNLELSEQQKGSSW